MYPSSSGKAVASTSVLARTWMLAPVSLRTASAPSPLSIPEATAAAAASALEVLLVLSVSDSPLAVATVLASTSINPRLLIVLSPSPAVIPEAVALTGNHERPAVPVPTSVWAPSPGLGFPSAVAVASAFTRISASWPLEMRSLPEPALMPAASTLAAATALERAVMVRERDTAVAVIVAFASASIVPRLVSVLFPSPASMPAASVV